ncbi:MAG: TetR family transcriptional regulator C-terminal domain-containing protein [Dehalococcoidia bacterium]
MCSEALDRNRQRFGTLDLAAASRAIFEELSTVYFSAAHEPGAVDAARLTLQVWEESTHSERAGKVLLEDFSMIQAHVSQIVSRAQERCEIDIELDPVAVAQTMVSLVLGLIVQRAAGTDVNIEKYEDAARALVTGRLWNSDQTKEEPATNPV